MRITTYGLGGFDPTKPDNNIVEVIEVPDEPAAPLDPVGSLAALLAVTGAVSVEDAANAVRLTVEQLQNEAIAWGMGDKP